MQRSETLLPRYTNDGNKRVALVKSWLAKLSPLVCTDCLKWQSRETATKVIKRSSVSTGQLR